MTAEAGNVGMGTALAAVLVTEKALVVANVGDSSVWELVDGRLVQLSTDDSPPGMSALPGVPSYVVTRPWVAGARSWMSSPTSSRIVEAERTVLLCSDGLTNFVGRRAIATTLVDDGPASTAALVQLAFNPDHSRNRVS